MDKADSGGRRDGGCQTNTLVVNIGNSCKRASMQGKTNEVFAAQIKPTLMSVVDFFF